MQTHEDQLQVPRVEFRPSTREAHHNRASRLDNHESRPHSRLSDDKDATALLGSGDEESGQRKSNRAVFLGTGIGSKALSSARSSIYDGMFNEEPLLKKYVRKVTLAGHSTNVFNDIRGDKIRKSKQTFSKACRILKITELRNFVKQIGERHINLSNQCLSWKELNAVISVLVNDEYTTSLDLSGNRLDVNSVGYLQKLVKANSHISDINLSNNNYRSSGLSELVDAMSAATYVFKLSLAGNQLSEGHVPHIARLIQVSQKITSLDLSHNEFREKGGMLLGDALGKNDDLLHLNLSWNHLRGKGAECVAIGLMKNSSLLSLDISWNGFGFDGCAAIGKALQNNTTLTELNISNNRIHPPALFEFLKGLTQNKSLVKLKMGDNPITALATNPLMCCIRDSKHLPLEEIDLKGVVVDSEFEFALEEVRNSRPNFRAIYEIALPVHKEKWVEMEKKERTDVVFNCDPVKILYYTQQNLRVVDLFHQMARGGSTGLTRKDIRDGLKMADFNLSSSAIDAIFNYLDTDNDGTIDLKEFLDGSRTFKRSEIAERKYQEQRAKLDVEEEFQGISADPGGAQTRFSSSYRPMQKYGAEFLAASEQQKLHLSKDKLSRSNSNLKLPNISKR